MMTNLFILARKIHRLLVLMIAVAGMVMAVTGVAIKYQIGDTGQLRFVHSQMSVIFTGLLVLMIFTGLNMYLFPLLRKKPS